MTKPLKASAAAVKRLRPGGWGDFKHKLHARGVIDTPVSDVPPEWIDAWMRAFRGKRRV